MVCSPAVISPIFLSERTWIWIHLKKACLQDLGGFRTSVALVAAIVNRVRWQRRAFRDPVDQSFFAATVTALRRECAAHIEIRGTG